VVVVICTGEPRTAGGVSWLELTVVWADLRWRFRGCGDGVKARTGGLSLGNLVYVSACQLGGQRSLIASAYCVPESLQIPFRGGCDVQPVTSVLQRLLRCKRLSVVGISSGHRA
jgi:hypothetical protein